DLRQRVECPLLHSSAYAVQRGEEDEIVQRRQPFVQAAVATEYHGQMGACPGGGGGDVMAAHERAARGRQEEGGQDLDKGGLPRAVGAQQPQHFAGLDNERHVTQRRHRRFAPKSTRNPFDNQRAHASTSESPSAAPDWTRRAIVFVTGALDSTPV